MKKTLFIAILFAISSQLTLGQTLKSPSEFLGYQLGSEFTRHHQVVDYFNYVSNTLNNVTVEKYGETNERRTLQLAFVSSKENMDNLENIRIDNLKRVGMVSGDPLTEIAIVWLSYNVHGNEASSTEAAMLTLYKLVTENKNLLENTLVIMDPCMNPDGRDRYVNWYNQIKSTPYNPNPVAREHREPWPGGRPNHYLFDLNRDWAWATQVESQLRLKEYNKWMPHVHVDFHEQGYNSPYYFAPAAAPYHEIITDWQANFQVEIGKNHARYFDKNGWRYFTKESFDLLYPSYGDTYPTYMGAIGMTYEQAGHGAAGLGINTEIDVELTLFDRIAHHTTTGISTVEVSASNSTELVNQFELFFDNSSLNTKNYILRGATEKINAVKSLLDKHEISYYKPENKTVKVFDYQSKSSQSLKLNNSDLIIPTSQPKGKMIKVLFEQNTKLTTPLTYDITAWSIPYAYGVKGYASESDIQSSAIQASGATIQNSVDKNAYAYVHKWNEVADGRFLGDLLEEGINVRMSRKDFSVDGKSYKRGTLIVIRGENRHILNFDEKMVEIAERLKQSITPVSTGFVDSGADFGSSSIALVTNKKMAVLAGDGTSSLSFGEIWHFFEKELEYPVHILNTSNASSITLAEYDVLILPSGYRANDDLLKKISAFANQGGTVIAIGSSINSFAGKDGYSLKRKSDDDDDSENKNLVPYDDREMDRVKGSISGAIFKSNVDNTHPLAYGYENHYYTLKRGAVAYELLEKGYNVAYLGDNNAHVSGYAGENALEDIPESLIFGTERKGSGSIVYMVDNPLFRSFWENGKLFFINAVFFN